MLNNKLDNDELNQFVGGVASSNGYVVGTSSNINAGITTNVNNINGVEFCICTYNNAPAVTNTNKAFGCICECYPYW